MNRTDAPKKQPVVFGTNGQREDLPDTTPAGDNTASYDAGFPAVTMILKSAGGLPPKGQDMNQILYELSAIGRWLSAGALNSYDATFSTAIGGYPKAAVLVGNDGTSIYISTADANTNDPNTTSTGWLSLAKITAIAALAGGANKLPYFNGENTAAQTDLTSVGRDIIGKASIADVLTYLGLGNSATRSVGTTAGTVAAGDDSRIVNAVQPSNPALCTAWVNFNGISPATIKSSHNVSSITRLSTGKYQINFTNPMGNTNYAPVFSYGDGATNGGASPAVMMDTASTTGNPLKTTTSTTMLIRSNTNVYDSTEVNAIFFGGM